MLARGTGAAGMIDFVRGENSHFFVDIPPWCTVEGKMFRFAHRPNRAFLVCSPVDTDAYPSLLI